MDFDWSFGLSDLFGIGGDAITAATMSAEAEKNRKFQEKVYKNRHQWTTQDMRAAGINPILAAASGQPTTAGAMANVPHMGQNVGKNPGRANLNAAREVMKAEQTAKQEQANLLRQQAALASTQQQAALLGLTQSAKGWDAARNLLGDELAGFQTWQSQQNMPWQVRMGTSAVQWLKDQRDDLRAWKQRWDEARRRAAEKWGNQ